MLLGLGTPSAAPWPYAALSKLPGGIYRLKLPYKAPGAGDAADADAAGDAAAADSADSTPPPPRALDPTPTPTPAEADRAVLGFLLGHYSFERYKKSARAASGGKEAGEASAAEPGSPVRGACSTGVQDEGEEAGARLVWPERCNR